MQNSYKIGTIAKYYNAIEQKWVDFKILDKELYKDEFQKKEINIDTHEIGVCANGEFCVVAHVRMKLSEKEVV